jgi:hypothetical protein
LPHRYDALDLQSRSREGFAERLFIRAGDAEKESIRRKPTVGARAVIAMENARLMLTLPIGWLIQVNTIAREKSNQVMLV